MFSRLGGWTFHPGCTGVGIERLETAGLPGGGLFFIIRSNDQIIEIGDELIEDLDLDWKDGAIGGQAAHDHPARGRKCGFRRCAPLGEAISS